MCVGVGEGVWVCVGVGEGVYLMSTSVRVELLPCVWVCGCVWVWVRVFT